MLAGSHWEVLDVYLTDGRCPLHISIYSSTSVTLIRAVPPPGTFGDVWGHFCCHGLEEGDAGGI